RMLRDRRNDAVIVSMFRQTVPRSRSMILLMLTASRAATRILRTEEGEWTSVSWWYLTTRFVPRLIVGGVLGLAVWITSVCVASLAQRGRKPARPVRCDCKTTVLMVRPDLAGNVKAGGSVSHVKGIVKAFVRKGFRVVYLSDHQAPSLPREVEQVIVPPIASLDLLDELQMIAYNLQLLLRLRSLVRRVQPDVVYQRHALHHYAGGSIARHAGVPYVLEVNASEVWIRSHWSRLIFLGHATSSEGLVLGRADTISVVSHGVREQLRSLDVSTDRIVVAPNGVDPEEFHPFIDGSAVRKRHGAVSATVVGFIGTFTKWHGVEALRDAIIAAAPSARLHFLLVGDGDLRSAIQRSVEEHGVAGMCTFTGLIPHAKAPEYLAACDILVSPHLGFSDGKPFFGSPTKLFEYMAMGKAIVATSLGQISEILTHERNALLVPPGDSGALLAAIVRAASDPALRARLGEAARRDVVEQHTWDKNIERILTSLEPDVQ
ncbi:MAG: glycosyltransferase family 4 protein, partial [Bacteroidota bacterium]